MEQEERLTEDQDGLLEPTPHEDIQAATQALELSQSFDPALMSEEEQAYIYGIRKMSLLITYQALYEIFEANFYSNSE
jgi:hypothetical protein